MLEHRMHHAFLESFVELDSTADEDSFALAATSASPRRGISDDQLSRDRSAVAARSQLDGY